VALARALAPQPALLLLDEPLSSLDRSLREHLTGELRDILRATGTTALYVTHDHDEAFTVADRVAVLAAGRLAQLDTPDRLWRAPASRTVAAFLGYGPFLPAQVADGAARTVLGEAPLGAGGAGGSVPPGAALLGLGPTALRVSADGGTPVAVTATRFRRGHTELDVVLPDGQRARALAGPHDVAAQRVRVRLDPAAAVVVPLAGG
jgi:thiamine transport system ATP-binding protein